MPKRTGTDGDGMSAGARALVFLGLALVAGGGAAALVWQMIDTYDAQIEAARAPEETVLVIVAAGDLFPGVTVEESDIVGVRVPKQYVPADAFLSPELVVGRIPRERILANEYVRSSRLADGQTGIGLNALVPPGMRAISIAINDGAAVSGFLEPGDRVDLVVTMADARGEPRTLTLLQAVPVLAVDGRTLNDDPAPAPDGPETEPARRPRPTAPSVTFAVTPEQAETIAHATRLGSLTLTLRSGKDVESVETPSVGRADVIPEHLRTPEPAPPAAPRARAPVPPPPPPREVKFLRGSSAETRTFDP